MWPGGEWRAPNASTPDKNNLAWQAVNVSSPAPRLNKFHVFLGFTNHCVFLEQLVLACLCEIIKMWTRYQRTVRRAFVWCKMPAYQLGCSGAVGGAADHAFLSGCNDKANLAHTCTRFSLQGGKRKLPGTRKWAGPRTRPWGPEGRHVKKILKFCDPLLQNL